MTNRKFKWIAALSVLAAVISSGVQPAEASFTTGSGYLSDATISGAVRYRQFNPIVA